MNQNNTKLTYTELTNQNITTAAKIQYELFNNSYNVGYLDYLEELNLGNNRTQKQLLPNDFLIYHNNTPIGIIGLYEQNKNSTDAWITWFGILKQYRNHGYGTQSLKWLIKLAQEHYQNKNTLRLNTYEKWNPQAQSLYQKIMHYSENYTNPNEAKIVQNAKPKIYTYNLKNTKTIPWNNQFLNLTQELTTLHEQSIKKLKEHNIIK